MRAKVTVVQSGVRVVSAGIQGPAGPPGQDGAAVDYVDLGDYNSRNRANHYGTQPSSTISDFNTAADARIEVQKALANGLATLGSDAKIPTSQLPALTITDTFVVASQAAMLALTAEVGDVAVRTDLNKTFILKTAGASTLGNWQELLTPTDAVLSVNGQTGAVTGLAPLASPALTGTPTAPTASAGTNTAQLATTAFVGTAIGNLINGAPGALDTLNELAAALGSDPNFATTVTNSLATKVAGPASATDNAVTRFDGTTGKLVQNSSVTINDAGGISTTIAAGGNTPGLTITQNDTTNSSKSLVVNHNTNGRAVDIANSGTGYALVIKNTATRLITTT